MSANTMITCTPLIVVSGIHSKLNNVELSKTSQVRTQLISLRAYTGLIKAKCEPGLRIIQQPQDKHPIPEDRLNDILKSNPQGERIVIEDFTRLISAQKQAQIAKQLEALMLDLPMMFSIRQHNTLIGLGAAGLFNLTMIETAQQLARSERAKIGIASKAPSTIKKASQKANAAKTRAAQLKAFKLRSVIQKIMRSKSDAEQSNRAAIARYLTEANVRTPSGKREWQSSTVTRVFKAAEAYDERTAHFRQSMEKTKQRIADRKQKQ